MKSIKWLLVCLLMLSPHPSFAGLKAVSGSIPGGDISSSTATATGATLARTLANHFADVKNAADFGAVCDGTALYDLTFTNSSTTVSSVGYHFTSADVGKVFVGSDVGVTQGTAASTTIASISGNNAILNHAWTGTTISTNDGRATFYTTDNTTALQNAINAFGSPNFAGYNQQGFRLVIPNGICATGPLTIPRLSIIECADDWNGCELFLKSGSNADMLVSEGFSANTGTGNNYGTTASVPSWFGLRNMHLDGNKIGQTTGRCVAWYGNMEMMLGEILIENCHDTCMHTEASDASAYNGTDWKSQEEGVFDHVKTRNCGAPGANGATATATITIATPGVITWNSHGLVAQQAIYFTTTGALPTGITAGTAYYVLGGASLTANTFQIATSIANSLAGTAVNTSGSQSGTQTATAAQSCASKRTGCGWDDEGPHDKTTIDFIDAESQSTGYYATALAGKYAGTSHIHKMHTYAETDGTGMVFGAGVTSTAEELYPDFANLEFGGTAMKIGSIFTTACGYLGKDCIIADGTATSMNVGYTNILYCNTGGCNSGATPNGIDVKNGANGVWGPVVGSIITPAFQTDIIKQESSFMNMWGMLSNATATNSDCLYNGGTYNVMNFTGYSCYNFADFVADGGNNTLNFPMFKSGGTNYTSSAIPASDTVNLPNDAGTGIYQQPGNGGSNGTTVAQSGDLGEIKISGGANTTATVTITNASPGVITWTTHGLTAYQAVNFTTTGALPTGLTVGTTYYVLSGASLTVNTFQVATSIANAVTGTAVNTSSAGSGTQTGVANATLASATAKDIAGLSLTAGDWDLRGTICYTANSLTTATVFIGGINNVTNTQPTPPGSGAYFQEALSVSAAGTEPCYSIGPTRVGVSATTTYFLDAQATFATSTMNAYGYFVARRVR